MTAATRRSCMLFFLCVAFGAAAHAAQRTFVATSGDDLNACSLVAPCRGFAKAITLTDPNGEIVVLDSGGYGAVTVNKNVTITSPAGVYGGLSVFGGNDGITIVAPAAKVVVRGLTINGQGGGNGVRVQSGEVHVENTIISNMTAAGILVEGGSTVRISGTVARSNVDGLRVVPGAGSVTVLVRDSEFSNNATAGIGVSPSAAGANAQVTTERASVTKNGAGLAVAPGAAASATLIVTQSVASENTGAGVSANGGTATVYVRESAVTRNGTGLLQQNAGVLNACGANLLVANTTAMSGAINTGSCLDVASGSGTVTNIATGAGLTGGPITTTGTLAVDTAVIQSRVSGTCAAGSSIRAIAANGTVVCEADDAGTGTVTSVATGTGLTGGPVTTTGTVSIANGGVGTTQLANSSVDVNKLNTISTDARYLKQGGNAFGVPAALGSTDNQQLLLRANNAVVMQYLPDPISPNLVGGHSSNNVTAGVRGATIAGGGALANSDPTFGNEAPNRVTDAYGTVGGGVANRAGDNAGTALDQPFATVAGGQENIASGVASTVGGGVTNTARGDYSTVGGGHGNTTSDGYSTVGGGHGNMASGYISTAGGGEINLAAGAFSTVVGGGSNTASGLFSTVGGGYGNTASGDYSVAMGRDAKAVTDGSFVWADSNPFDFSSGTVNRFYIRATGGMRVVTEIDGTGATTWSCLATAGNSWSCASDRNLKHSLVELDGKAVLAKLAAMPLYQWQPKGQNAHVKHYGPMAQDFHAAFGLGDDDKMIGMQDADGVALAAIQGVNQKVDAQMRARDEEIAALRSSLFELKRTVEALLAAR